MSQEADVVEQGKNGYLFLSGGGQNVKQYLTGELALDEKRIKNFDLNIAERRKVAASRGVKYCHIVCPDKHSVLPDLVPFNIKHLLGDIFLKQAQEKFIYPVSELRNCALGPAYLKTDTHWSVFGVIEASRVMLESIGIPQEDFSDKHIKIKDKLVIRNNYSGDLGSKLVPRVHEQIFEFSPFSSIFQESNNLSGSNGTINTIFNPSVKSGRLLIFGDSFIMSCLSMLSLSFRNILFIRSPYFHREIFEMYLPTHMLTANVERYLSSVPLDYGAGCALLMCHLTERSMSPTKNFYSMLDAMLTPNSPFSKAYFDREEFITK